MNAIVFFIVDPAADATAIVQQKSSVAARICFMVELMLDVGVGVSFHC